MWIKSKTHTLLFSGCLLLLLELGHNRSNAVSMSEDITLSFEEAQALQQFRKKVIPILPEEYMRQDIYLIRWLRARKLNVDAATVMLKNNLRWRRDQKMDTINDEDWSDMEADYPYTCNMHDNDGRPLGTANLGAWNIRRMALAGKMPRLQRYMAKLLEEGSQLVRQAQVAGNNVTQFKILFNLEGFNSVEHASPICLPAYTYYVRTYEEHYPGLVDETIHINTPMVYEIVLTLVRPLFSPATRKSVIVFGQNKTEWMAYLDKRIKRNQRRKEYGGTL